MPEAELRKLSRRSIYYDAEPVPPGDLAIMRQNDELHLTYPFAGRRMLRDLLRADGVAIGREKVATLIRRMGIEVIYRTQRSIIRHCKPLIPTALIHDSCPTSPHPAASQPHEGEGEDSSSSGQYLGPLV